MEADRKGAANTVLALSIGGAIKNSFRAMISPRTTFKGLYRGKLDYRFVIPIILLAGAANRHLHDLIVHHYFLFTQTYAELLTIGMSCTSFNMWVLGCIGFYTLCRSVKSNIDFKTIEVGVFYLWMIWAVMPLMDFPHLLGLNFFRYHPFSPHDTCIHFSLLPAAILVGLESFFFSRYTLKLGRLSILPPLLILPIGKFVLPQVPFLFGIWYMSVKPYALLREIDALSSILPCPLACAIWCKLSFGTSLRRTLCIAIPLSAALLLLFLFIL